MNKIIKFLNQPYPYNYDLKTVLKISFGIGFFVFLFLFIFVPIEKQELSSDIPPVWIYIGFGIISFIVSFLNNLIAVLKLFPKLLNEDNWNVKYEIIGTWWMIFSIGLINYAFYCIVFTSDFSLNEFWQIQLNTFVLGSIPITFLIIIDQNRQLKKNLASAVKINDELEYLKEELKADYSTPSDFTLSSDNEKETVFVNQDSLLFLHSAGNYVEICLYQNNKPQLRLLRTPLKRLESIVLQSDVFFKCHRTYIVNIHCIDHVSGNSQEYKLHIRGTNYIIPVSRQFTNSFQNYIKSFYKSYN
ncbi:MAG: LytTR family transcriptional regulator [Calditrichaceae bacterium]|nr:LytTR family transcriptional regulator [Calditrichaceae bacterium]